MLCGGWRGCNGCFPFHDGQSWWFSYTPVLLSSKYSLTEFFFTDQDYSVFARWGNPRAIFALGPAPGAAPPPAPAHVPARVSAPAPASASRPIHVLDDTSSDDDGDGGGEDEDDKDDTNTRDHYYDADDEQDRFSSPSSPLSPPTFDSFSPAQFQDVMRDFAIFKRKGATGLWADAAEWQRRQGLHPELWE